jgi:hypothetical protein
VKAYSAEGRRFIDVCHDLAQELGGDPTAAELLQIRVIATQTLNVDRMQAQVMAGEAIDTDVLTRAANSIARATAALRRGRAGRKAKAGPVGIGSYLASRAVAE